MRPYRHALLAAILFAAPAFAAPAFAGEPYEAPNGYAVGGYDLVAYFGLPRGQTPPADPVPGQEGITAEYGGATYAFATEENRDAFLAEPARYLPRYDGHCAFGASVGVKAPGDPQYWRIVGETLYFNSAQRSFDLWQQDIPGKIDTATQNWVSLDAKPASADAPPEFRPALPPRMN